MRRKETCTIRETFFFAKVFFFILFSLAQLWWLIVCSGTQNLDMGTIVLQKCLFKYSHGYFVFVRIENEKKIRNLCETNLSLASNE